jgi:hypothetical protein
MPHSGKPGPRDTSTILGIMIKIYDTCRISPEQTSLGSDSSEPLLSLWLFTKVPLLLFVSWWFGVTKLFSSSLSVGQNELERLYREY